MPIKRLDKEVIAQIAAGEVVERPASVVKELLENSLDAGSSQISVEVGGGGISLVRVIDDGTGIPAAEVGLAFERYATSKIGSVGDLQSIATLGFRGEALASIAAAGDVDIVTCAAGEAAGSAVRLEDGVTVRRGEQGRSQGTTVTVRNLFRKVPARLKFLKSTATENSHITDVISRYALAYPEVKFNLTADGKLALKTPGRGQLIDSIIEVYGVEVAQHMLDVKSADAEWQSGKETVKVSGMAGSPEVSRSGRGYLSFFVNRRWVESRLLSWAVEEAYRGLLMTGKHPLAVINISVTPREVDVNVHPTKSEVRFQNEHAVFGAVQKTMRRTLIEQTPVPRIEEVAVAFAPPRSQGQGLWTPPAPTSPSTPIEATQPLAVYLPVLRVLGQAFSSYIVAEGPDGVYIIDQHAAHERILFEQVKQQMSIQEVQSQSLLEPATFEVEAGQQEAFESCYRDLARSGFLIEPFGNRTYLVRGIPGVLSGKDWTAALREMVETLASSGGSDREERMAASIACHGAVRAGQALSDAEMRELVRQMEKVANPHTCPHGRPTIIHLSTGRLAREFGRS